MSLENEVPSRELCQRWKEIGGRQDTELYWICAWNRWTLDLAKNCRTWNGEKIAAPLASEIIPWFPRRIEVTYFDGTYGVYFYPMRGSLRKDTGEHLPNILMQMLIELEVPCQEK